MSANRAEIGGLEFDYEDFLVTGSGRTIFQTGPGTALDVYVHCGAGGDAAIKGGEILVYARVGDDGSPWTPVERAQFQSNERGHVLAVRGAATAYRIDRVAGSLAGEQPSTQRVRISYVLSRWSSAAPLETEGRGFFDRRAIWQRNVTDEEIFVTHPCILRQVYGFSVDDGDAYIQLWDGETIVESSPVSLAGDTFAFDYRDFSQARNDGRYFAGPLTIRASLHVSNDVAAAQSFQFVAERRGGVAP